MKIASILCNLTLLLRNAVFWDVTACGYCKNWLDTANVVPSSPNLVALMMEALRSSDMSVLTRVTRRKSPEDGILHSHLRENLKSYNIVLLYNIICPTLAYKVT
jgi:hypothetical protein